MSTYSNAPSVSGQVITAVTAENISSWTTAGVFPYLFKYKLLYEAPAGSYAIINIGLQQSGATRVGVTPYLVASNSIATSTQPSFEYVYSTDADVHYVSGIYVGPGTQVFIETASSSSPGTGTAYCLISGVQFTNGS